MVNVIHSNNDYAWAISLYRIDNKKDIESIDDIAKNRSLKNRWRFESKLFFPSFSLFFFFGFQLGGAVNRQDFKCHLDKDGQYSRAKEYDYPSLAEISRLLQDHKVNLIFAVTEDRREEYELISDLLKEKARVATLADSSSNILEIIESSYHEIVSKLVLRDNSSEPLKLEYFSNCGKEDGESIIVNKAECDGIQEGQVYEFKVVFSMGSCPRNESLWVSK